MIEPLERRELLSPLFSSGNSFSVSEANTNGVTGPSTSTTPYLTSTNSDVQFTSILTVGDTIGGYRMVGIPDGMGAFDNGDGTFTLLLNHELNNTVGVARAHGQKGSFVSRWMIDSTTLQVVPEQQQPVDEHRSQRLLGCGNDDHQSAVLG